MPTILGIDAAWTVRQPSGVALVAYRDEEWRCLAVAPSYETFLGLARGVPVDWEQPRFSGSAPDAESLLQAARDLADATVDVVTVDMPVATTPITDRRLADDAISRAFGGRGCSVHTPSISRPGTLGEALTAGFLAAGYPVATALTPPGLRPNLVEVYPHPALLTLLNRPYRVPYKVSRARRYWPERTPAQRVAEILEVFQAIDDALTEKLGSTGLCLPPETQIRSLAQLKRYEDALDALVCAWVGTCYVEGSVEAFGDETAAIFCPRRN
jgi:predicted RNase H-like nuclease